MRFLFDYLFYRRRIIIVILTIAGVFLIFMLLYGVPTEAVIYSGLISAVITAAAAFGDFWRYYQKYKLLKELRGEILVTLDRLPECDNETERCYQELLELLQDEKRRLVSAADRRYDNASVYFTMWTHQIKTPIFAMSLALSESDSETSQELLENLSRIEQYVEMALCYVHLDNEESDLVITECSLDSIIKQAVKKFSSQFISRKIRIVYEPVKLRILTDEKWLLFVVEQIISNALKYTRTGSVQITVKNDEKLGRALSVKDTGIGIAAEDLPRVFERGFTGRNGREDKKATGIGLYLCKRVCRRLGTDIEARSDGHGTEILIGLPKNDIDTRD